MTYYVPESSPFTGRIITELLVNIDKRKKQLPAFEAIGMFLGDKTDGNHHVVESKRLYVYTESGLSSRELKELDDLSKTLQIFVTVRGRGYADRKRSIEKPIAFISHDSRDKDLIARPVADGLRSRYCTVW